MCSALHDALSCVGRLESACVCVHEEAKKLHQAIAEHCFDEMKKSSCTITDHIHQIAVHCNINLVNNALRDWQGALKKRGATELNAVSELFSNIIPNYWLYTCMATSSRPASMCHRLEKYMLSLEAHVYGATANLPQQRNQNSVLHG